MLYSLPMYNINLCLTINQGKCAKKKAKMCISRYEESF